jgi:serine/threonine protein kinase
MVLQLPPGKELAGRFRIVRFIAAGGMGDVYEVEDLQLGERLAIKTIRPEVVHDARAIAALNVRFSTHTARSVLSLLQKGL